MVQSVNDALRSGKLHDILRCRNEHRYLNNTSRGHHPTRETCWWGYQAPLHWSDTHPSPLPPDQGNPSEGFVDPGWRQCDCERGNMIHCWFLLFSWWSFRSSGSKDSDQDKKRIVSLMLSKRNDVQVNYYINLKLPHAWNQARCLSAWELLCLIIMMLHISLSWYYCMYHHGISLLLPYLKGRRWSWN